MDKQWTVVLLDSGIEREHKAFEGANIRSYANLDDGQGWREHEVMPENGHGTGVASVLVKHLTNKSVEIISVKIFDDETFEADLSLLVDALTFIYHHINCQAINISVGTLKDDPELMDICEKIAKKGIHIISAFSNEGMVSFPAAYDFVLGVDATGRLKDFGQHIFVKNSLINCGMPAGNQRVAWTDPPYIIDQGNSYITPIITAKLINAMAQGVVDIMGYLQETAFETIEFEPDQESETFFQIQKAAVFPCNKETKNIVRFSHLLPFEMEALYDSKYSGQVGMKIEDANLEKEYAIKNIDSISYEDIDTLVIGHTGELNFRSGKNYRRDLLDQCASHGVNVVSFDEMAQDEGLNSTIKYYSPTITRNKRTHNKFGKLYKIFAPVLGVVGTSSQQGKFTVQLRLRELFNKNGYQIAQLSTEPNGELFGMDAVFPYGYSGTVQIEGLEMIEHVNAMMHLLDRQEPELILVGAQSGVCTINYDHLSMYSVDSSNFVLGANPDAVVVCVNYHDTPEVIARSAMYVESLAQCRVVAFAVFPFAYEDQWGALRNIKKPVADDKLEAFCQNLHKNTGIPCYRIGDRIQEEEMFNRCISFFEYVSEE